MDCGALVEELQLSGERLHYRLRSGKGPSEGWVSLRLKGKALLAREQPDGGQAAAEVDDPSLTPEARYVADMERLRASYKEVASLVRLIRAERLKSRRGEAPVPAKETGPSTWRCIHKPRIMTREGASPDAKITGFLNHGQEVEAKGEASNGWLHLANGSFAMVHHEKLGQLLELVGGGNAAAKIEGRVGELLERLKAQLDVYGLSTVVAEEATDRLLVKMKEAETFLAASVGQVAARNIAAGAATQATLAEDGSEMFTCDLFGTGRGLCQRCGACPWYRWKHELDDPQSTHCHFCDCSAAEHKSLGDSLGKTPGWHPDMTDEDLEKMEELHYEFERHSAWN